MKPGEALLFTERRDPRTGEPLYDSAVVQEVDGKLVLVDPTAVAFVRAVERENCRRLVLHDEFRDRVEHFQKRARERGLSCRDVAIIVANVDDPQGKQFADALMPGHDWQAYRDRGEVPFARGLANAPALEAAVRVLDPAEADKLHELGEQELREPNPFRMGVIVVDRGVVAVFPISELRLSYTRGPGEN